MQCNARNSPLSSQDTWIAGEITQKDGAFSWMDGTPWDYDNWDVGESEDKMLELSIETLLL